MSDEITGPVDLGTEAAIELEEIRQNVRTEAPAFSAFMRWLQTPVPAMRFEGRESVSMLDDMRSYSVLREALDVRKKMRIDHGQFRVFLGQYLSDLEDGVSRKDQDKILEAKRFCLSLASGLLHRQTSEIYQQRERADQRFINHDVEH